MKTKLTAFLLAMVICVSLIPFASAAEVGTTAAGLDNFQKSSSYPGFSDVQSSAWYADSVKQAYELGLMNGKGLGKFDPTGTLTLAEAVTIAARINAIYQGKAFAPGGDPWYSDAVTYVTTAGIIVDGYFADFNELATRANLANMLYKSIPEYEFLQINEINTIPDVPSSQAGSEYIYVLYRAGVLTGSNDGSFTPNAPITRAEVAAIINRVVLPQNRVLQKTHPENSTGTISGANGDFTITIPEGTNWKNIKNEDSNDGVSELAYQSENGRAVLRIFCFNKGITKNTSTYSVITAFMKDREDKGYRTSGERMATNEAGFVNAGFSYSPKRADGTSWEGEFACIETSTRVYAIQAEMREDCTETEKKELSDIVSTFSIVS